MWKEMRYFGLLAVGGFCVTVCDGSFYQGIVQMINVMRWNQPCQSILLVFATYFVPCQCTGLERDLPLHVISLLLFADSNRIAWNYGDSSATERMKGSSLRLSLVSPGTICSFSIEPGKCSLIINSLSIGWSLLSVYVYTPRDLFPRTYFGQTLLVLALSSPACVHAWIVCACSCGAHTSVCTGVVNAWPRLYFLAEAPSVNKHGRGSRVWFAAFLI